MASENNSSNVKPISQVSFTLLQSIELVEIIKHRKLENTVDQLAVVCKKTVEYNDLKLKSYPLIFLL